MAQDKNTKPENLQFQKQEIHKLNLNKTDINLAQNNPEDEKIPEDLAKVFNIPVKISVVLGKKKIKISELIKLKENDIIKLDRNINEAIDIFVNDRLIARGEIVMLDSQIGVTMTEIVKQKDN